MPPTPRRALYWCPTLVMLAGLPLIAVALVNLESNVEDVRQWLPGDSPERRNYNEFVDVFGVDDLLIVSWPGCTLDDDRLAKLDDALTGPSAPTGAGSQPLVRRVVTGPEMLARLTSEPLRLEREVALNRLAGVFVGPGFQTTCAIVEASEAGRADRKAVVAAVQQAAEECCELSRGELRLAGNIYLGVAADEQTIESFMRLIVPSCLVSLVAAWFCLRSIREIAIIAALALYAQGIGVSVVYFAGEKMNGILIAMPTLILVLTVSGGIHLINYYRAAIADGAGAGAPWTALRHGWVPCSLAAISTAIGMASLSVSSIDTIRTFGLFSAFSLMIALALLLTFVPTALVLWPRRDVEAPDSASDSDATAADTVARPNAAESVPVRAANFFIRYRLWVLAGSLAAVMLVGVGIVLIRTSVDLERLFHPRTDIIQDYNWLEEHLGPLEPMEIVVRFDEIDPERFIDRMELIDEIEESIVRVPMLAATFSPASFVPVETTATDVSTGLRRRVIARRLEKNRDEFIGDQYVAEHEGDEYWRIHIRVSALEDLDYDEFTEDLQEQVDGVLERSPLGQNVTDVIYTGVWPLFYKGQHQLFGDLAKSFAAAYMMITPVMMLVFGGFRAGLVSMVPNLIPALTVYGSMGWLGIPIDLGAVVAASVGLGIAVDDTLHFLTWFRRGVHDGLSRPDAIRSSFAKCAPAMFQTTLICGLGVAVFCFSTFLPSARFSTLMVFLLVMALVGDLVVLSAIVAGRTGKVFYPLDVRRRSRRKKTDG